LVEHALSSSREGSPSGFPGSRAYWESRYAAGANSGAGSYDAHAEFKAEVLNAFVARHEIKSVIELGCGDGNQLRLAEYPSYKGFDVSSTAVAKCAALFKSDKQKSFHLMSEYSGEVADLALSLDVVYHLVEEAVFDEYMQLLFNASNRHVIVYSSNFKDDSGSAHVKHREFTKWVEVNATKWRLVDHLPNRNPFSAEHPDGSFAEFFMFQKVECTKSP
jgi:hypothetical protein